uniref:Peptidase A2 domain-containing protein n=1 Tax=Paramormyrops kingsleyae TaxID=1676925 RepID=A0A3B3R2G6_9TELE
VEKPKKPHHSRLATAGAGKKWKMSSQPRLATEQSSGATVLFRRLVAIPTLDVISYNRPAGLSGVSAPALSRPVFMPDTFTGVNREWSGWVEQFEMTAVVNGWDEEVKLKFMSLLLSGKAREVYTGLPPQTRRVPALKQEGPEVEIPPMVSLCGQGLYIGAQVGGIEAYLLVDTGAQVSVVPRSFWESVTGGRQELVPYVGAVAVANGAELKILGKWCTVYLLLGNDFLTQYGAVIDVKGQCCQVMGKMVPLVAHASSKQPWIVTLTGGDAPMG